MTTLSKNRNYFQGLLKQYQQTADSGDETSFTSSTSPSDKDPNETVIDTGNGAIENTEGNVKVSSRLHRDYREGDRLANYELENLRAEKEAEQRLRARARRNRTSSPATRGTFTTTKTTPTRTGVTSKDATTRRRIASSTA